MDGCLWLGTVLDLYRSCCGLVGSRLQSIAQGGACCYCSSDTQPLQMMKASKLQMSLHITEDGRVAPCYLKHRGFTLYKVIHTTTYCIISIRMYKILSRVQCLTPKPPRSLQQLD